MLAAQLALAFGLELWALVAFGLWGVLLGPTPVSRVALGVGAPLLIAVFWGTFLSPKAARPLSPMGAPWAKLAVFALAAVALWVTGHTAQSVVFGGLVALNLLSLRLLEPHNRLPNDTVIENPLH